METLSRDPPLAHVTTFGGHPLACAAGLAALEVLLRDDLPARGAVLGERLVAVRRLGLLLGLEFARADLSATFARIACALR